MRLVLDTETFTKHLTGVSLKAEQYVLQKTFDAYQDRDAEYEKPTFDEDAHRRAHRRFSFWSFLTTFFK